MVLGRAYTFTEAKELGNLYIHEVLNFLEPAIGGDHPANALNWAKTLGTAGEVPETAEEFVSYYLDTRPKPRYAPQTFQIYTSRLLGGSWPGGELLFSWRGEYHSMGLRAVSNLPLTLLIMSGLVDGTSSGDTSAASLDSYFVLTRPDAGHVRLSVELPGLETERRDDLDLPPIWNIPLDQFCGALTPVIENEVENLADQPAMHDLLTLAVQRINSRILTPP